MSIDDRWLLERSRSAAKQVAGGNWDRLTPADQTLFSVLEFEAEVGEGGFRRYFHGSAGGRALDARLALEAVGLSEWGRLLDRALDAFPDRRPPKETRARRDLIPPPNTPRGLEWERLEVEFHGFGGSAGPTLRNWFADAGNSEGPESAPNP